MRNACLHVAVYLAVAQGHLTRQPRPELGAEFRTGGIVDPREPECVVAHSCYSQQLTCAIWQCNKTTPQGPKQTRTYHLLLTEVMMRSNEASLCAASVSTSLLQCRQVSFRGVNGSLLGKDRAPPVHAGLVCRQLRFLTPFSLPTPLSLHLRQKRDLTKSSGFRSRKS